MIGGLQITAKKRKIKINMLQDVWESAITGGAFTLQISHLTISKRRGGRAHKRTENAKKSIEG